MAARKFCCLCVLSLVSGVAAATTLPWEGYGFGVLPSLVCPGATAGQLVDRLTRQALFRSGDGGLNTRL